MRPRQIGVVVAGMRDQLPRAGGQIVGAAKRAWRRRGFRWPARRWRRRWWQSLLPPQCAGRPAPAAAAGSPRRGAATARRAWRARLQAGSKGLRTARMPAARAARSTGRSTAGNMCVCLCVSMWVSATPLDWSSANLRGGLSFDLGGADAAREEAAQEYALSEMRKTARAAGRQAWESGCGRAPARHPPAPHGSPRPAWAWSGQSRWPHRWRRPAPSAWRWSALRPVQLGNGAVDPGGQPKVVGIEDETAHRVSLSTQAAVLWSARRSSRFAHGKQARCYDEERPQRPSRRAWAVSSAG